MVIDARGTRLFGFILCLVALDGCAGKDHPPVADDSPVRSGSTESGQGGEEGSDRPPTVLTPATSSNPCAPSEENPDADVVSVHGRVGALGSVAITIEGVSRGLYAVDGVQHTTDSSAGQSGSPEIDEVTLWLWADLPPAKVGKLYKGNNRSIRDESFINIDIFASGEAGVNCPDGEGTGTFSFDKFQDDDVIASGTYKFQCDASDIDVSGCFRYAK